MLSKSPVCRSKVTCKASDPGCEAPESGNASGTPACFVVSPVGGDFFSPQAKITDRAAGKKRVNARALHLRRRVLIEALQMSRLAACRSQYPRVRSHEDAH